MAGFTTIQACAFDSKKIETNGDRIIVHEAMKVDGHSYDLVIRLSCAAGGKLTLDRLAQINQLAVVTIRSYCHYQTKVIRPEQMGIHIEKDATTLRCFPTGGYLEAISIPGVSPISLSITKEMMSKAVYIDQNNTKEMDIYKIAQSIQNVVDCIPTFLGAHAEVSFHPAGGELSSRRERSQSRHHPPPIATS